jgi:NAD(P)-dependent dehydrogenase (short-subunit alcohol dehydrogenase family)
VIAFYVTGLIQDVHLKGAFKTTQAAWPHLRKQNYRHVIVTSSNSGLYGKFGEAKLMLQNVCLTMFLDMAAATSALLHRTSASASTVESDFSLQFNLPYFTEVF